MKIHFDNVNFSAVRSGPNGFANELARQFINCGHDIVDTPTSADIDLVFIEKVGYTSRSGVKTVLRLDGIWSKPSDIVDRNVNIRATYETADAVVFQSEFDKGFIESLWGMHPKSAVIMNGVQINPVREFTLITLQELRSKYDYVFSCSANWHRQKRLQENIECFKSIRNSAGKQCCMLVLGANPDHFYANKDVFYSGSVHRDVYMQIFSMSDFMIHLAWRDHCPNTVVQAISQNTPVICTDDGGTHEIVREFGIVLPEKSGQCTEPFDYENPPTLDFSSIDWATKLKSVKGAKPRDVSIETCAKKYEELFRSIL